MQSPRQFKTTSAVDRNQARRISSEPGQRSIATRLSDAEFVSVIGRGSVDFLNRLSTNDLGDIVVGNVRSTVFTTEKGKIVDVATVLCRREDLLLIVSPGNATTVKSWLDRFIIMEDLVVEDLSSSIGAIELYGPDQTEAMESLLNDQIRLSTDGFVESRGIMIFQDPLWHGGRTCVLAPRDKILECWTSLKADAGKFRIQILGEDRYESFRIESGIPAYGKEITGDVNPLEAGLTNQVSFTKGCYIGQEIIARLDTYGKLQKRLAGFLLDQKLPRTYELPCRITRGGREAGFLTSYSFSSKLQQHLSLGYLKMVFSSGEFEVVSDAGNVIMATVAGLPFGTNPTDEIR